MLRKKQEIKTALHIPTEMDTERQKQMEEFWVEKIVASIERFNLNEQEQKKMFKELNAQLER